MSRKDGEQALHDAALQSFNDGKLEQALALMQACAAAYPGNAAIQSDLGGLFNLSGRLDQAEVCFRRALDIAPTNAQAHYNLGCTLQAQGKQDAALPHYEQANALAPGNAEILCNLGGCLQELGKSDQAIACYREALAQNPDDINSLNNLGVSLFTNGKLEEAIHCFERTLALRPDFARAFINLGMTHFDRGQLEEALACYRQALAIDPAYSEAFFSVGVVLHSLHRTEEAIAAYRQAIAIKNVHANTFSNLLMTMQFDPGVDADTLLAEHRRFSERFEAPLKPHWPVHGNVATPNRRLKIGYMSGDFRTHAVAYFIEPILAHHDKSQVEVHCYANNVRRDQVTERLIALADHWQPCSGMTDEQLARRITADGIDVLVDLSGHTAHNRLITFARKPAPIQITYVGYLSTTGLGAMDYRLTDHLADPPGSERFYAETLLRLPDSTWCFQPPAEPAEISPLPALANGYLTFGSFNNIDKISGDVIQLWANLLARLPTSRLLMLAVPEVQQDFLRQFVALGVAAERINFCGKVSPLEYRKLLQTVDISLDSFPVNGATTTCESLWQGVPVLSLHGERLLSRNGLSILHAAQMPDFAASSPEQLSNTAVLLANNLALLANIRAGMREHLLTTPLFDHARFTKNLESIYRQVWQDWCARRAEEVQK